MSKKYFSNKYAKLVTLNSLTSSINELQKSDNKLAVHTANGIYIGTLRNPVEYNSLKVQENDDFLTIYSKEYLQLLDDYENKEDSTKAEKISENSISIILENVKLLSNSNLNLKMDFVEIFIDQIIGFSIGECSLKE